MFILVVSIAYTTVMCMVSPWLDLFSRPHLQSDADLVRGSNSRAGGSTISLFRRCRFRPAANNPCLWRWQAKTRCSSIFRKDDVDSMALVLPDVWTGNRRRSWRCSKPNFIGGRPASPPHTTVRWLAVRKSQARNGWVAWR